MDFAYRNSLIISPITPDMIPSDFNIFLHVKSLKVGRNLNEDDKMKDDILIYLTLYKYKWLQSQTPYFYEEEHDN